VAMKTDCLSEVWRAKQHLAQRAVVAAGLMAVGRRAGVGES